MLDWETEDPCSVGDDCGGVPWVRKGPPRRRANPFTWPQLLIPLKKITLWTTAKVKWTKVSNSHLESSLSLYYIGGHTQKGSRKRRTRKSSRKEYNKIKWPLLIWKWRGSKLNAGIYGYYKWGIEITSVCPSKRVLGSVNFHLVRL